MDVAFWHAYTYTLYWNTKQYMGCWVIRLEVLP